MKRKRGKVRCENNEGWMTAAKGRWVTENSAMEKNGRKILRRKAMISLCIQYKMAEEEECNQA